MFPGVNPRQMQKMMQKMGMQQVDLRASKVVITLEDKELVFENPQVSKINMMGQETFQIIGTPSERALNTMPDISEEDIQTIMSQVGCTPEEARAAMEKTGGDIAEAIMSLSGEN